MSNVNLSAIVVLRGHLGIPDGDWVRTIIVRPGDAPSNMEAAQALARRCDFSDDLSSYETRPALEVDGVLFALTPVLFEVSGLDRIPGTDRTSQAAARPRGVVRLDLPSFSTTGDLDAAAFLVRAQRFVDERIALGVPVEESVREINRAIRAGLGLLPGEGDWRVPRIKVEDGRVVLESRRGLPPGLER